MFWKLPVDFSSHSSHLDFGSKPKESKLMTFWVAAFAVTNIFFNDFNKFPIQEIGTA